MKVGLISDTHGDVARTTRAAELFRAAGVQAVLHAGDVGSEAVLDELRALDVPVHAVVGNTDYGLDLPAFFEAELGGKRFAIAHGHDTARLKNAIRGGRHDYVITGHTHEQRDDCMGKTRVINPGAIFRSSRPSVAVLDTDTDELKFVEL
jgi:hypothetical protein